MAGGIGSRFWPMSRTSHPKQFIDMLGTGRTLLQQTYDRFLKICPKQNIYIVTNDSYKDLVLKQIPQLSPENILGEPVRRNTAPCIAYATYKIMQKDDKANIIVAPSDHLITKEDAFVEAVNTALSFTEKHDCLLSLGIQPSRPDTGYGYIQFIENKNPKDCICKVKAFTEKPDLELAKFFLQSKEFLWNSGINIWNINSIDSAFKKYMPELHTIFSEGSSDYFTDNETDFIKEAYAQSTNISIDYGIMEKANNVYVIAADIGWTDLGTWGSQYENSAKDADGNAVVGNNVMLYDSHDNIINIPKNKLVILQGLDDYIVVESDNILLICRKHDEQQIRQFVSDVKKSKGDKFI
jgi:mannose-1-phosphate guanylyltransferase